ncbi:MAG TPA: hypothetical protein VFB43_18975 [Terracidiphilus sp.]|nr:hypothetical protein [Terracidiphilus sp.]
MTLAFGIAVLAGCSQHGGSGSSSGGGSGSGGGPAVDITGNWQIQFTPTHSPAPISSMAGYLSQQGQGANQFTTAALQAQTSGCFSNATTVPMTGQTSGTDVNLASFAIDGQTLSINAQANAGGNQFSGSYSIAGGCAGGAKGTVAGTEYASLSGTFSGPITGSSPAVTLSLSLSQSATGTGLGTFPLSGSAAFSGISCFSQGTLASENGSVIGDSVIMDFTTNDSQGAQIQMTGTFDTAASTLTLSSIQVTGGSCGGTLGSATLLRQH